MTDYGVLFRELAIPRLVGTPNHRKVREILKRELDARGFAVEEHAFAGRPSRALRGTPREVNGINLIARRGGAPAVWLVAHYDSKGQPHSMMGRLLWVLLSLAGLLALVFEPSPALALFVGVIFLSGFLQNRVTDNSPGAVDNATALVAILMTVDQLSRAAQVGVVFPDAEELGLAGARALARERTAFFNGTTVINLDGLDDIGRTVAFLHRPGEVTRAAAQALGATRARWLPVIVDGIVLSRVARECMSVLKGGMTTMFIVHTPRDAADRVRLDGAASVAAGLARVLRGR